MAEQVKFKKFKNDTREALALDMLSFDSETKKLTAYSSANSTIKEEVVLPLATEEEVQNLISLVGSPLKAATVAEMTDTDKIYVYTGSETDYTNGHWYYYDGTTWTDGGAYNAAPIETDTTLSVSGGIADAKATGDAISSLNTELTAKIAAVNFDIVVDANGHATLERTDLTDTSEVSY